MNTHTIVVDIRQNMLKTRDGAGSKDGAVSSTRIIYVTE